ncbi:hypothetical protein B0H19DRAFT_1275073 [Mycena capillaripes]|nr:hypothetical protein B0H19DRAFT_1275073 [Mycena capillaripes]
MSSVREVYSVIASCPRVATGADGRGGGDNARTRTTPFDWLRCLLAMDDELLLGIPRRRKDVPQAAVRACRRPPLAPAQAPPFLLLARQRLPRPHAPRFSKDGETPLDAASDNPAGTSLRRDLAYIARSAQLSCHILSSSLFSFPCACSQKAQPHHPASTREQPLARDVLRGQRPSELCAKAFSQLGLRCTRSQSHTAIHPHWCSAKEHPHPNRRAAHASGPSPCAAAPALAPPALASPALGLSHPRAPQWKTSAERNTHLAPARRRPAVTFQRKQMRAVFVIVLGWVGGVGRVAAEVVVVKAVIEELSRSLYKSLLRCFSFSLSASTPGGCSPYRFFSPFPVEFATTAPTVASIRSHWVLRAATSHLKPQAVCAARGRAC